MSVNIPQKYQMQLLLHTLLKDEYVLEKFPQIEIYISYFSFTIQTSSTEMNILPLLPATLIMTIVEWCFQHQSNV